MIRKATIEDLPKLKELADEFYSSSEFLVDFDLDYFCSMWKQFILSGIGVIWILNDFDGMFGAMKYRNINNGMLTACEIFWFVAESKRGQGMELLKTFESWAKQEGCKRIIMAYLEDLMPDVLKNVYKRRGYKPMEVHYVKEIGE